MSNNSIFSQLLAVIILIGFIACQKAEKTQLVFDENIFRETDLVGEFVTTEGQTVLGDVIDIPYSIENLLKAYDNLPAQTKSQINPNLLVDEFDVVANHNAVIGAFDENMLFYLMSRGINQNDATKLLCEGLILNNLKENYLKDNILELVNEYWG